MKINEGNVTDIVCPGLNCYAIVSPDVIGQLVSSETAKRFFHFDIRAFVDQNPNIRWCPSPGCGMAVKNPRTFNKKVVHKKVIVPHVHEQHNVIGEFAMTADCGQGHFFCWDCAREGHEPATCQNWRDWFEKIGELRPETLTNTSEKEELSANYLWLVTHSKSCPNPSCLAPIQKHDGCNHIR
jgi:ankyrin repeat/IBR domain-containing protein 1